MKKFLISIDTEGDNLWEWKNGDKIYTENTKYLYRFQALCEEYGYKPTYLTNYEMACAEEYQKFAKRVIKENTGEIGMHLHAWNTPPETKLNNMRDNPEAAYLIEYDNEAMEQKISTMTTLLNEVFETEPITHRAGRWATNDIYFELLKKYNYRVDCSVTPHLNWGNCAGATEEAVGSDYTNASEQPYFLTEEYGKLIEIPVTVRKSNKFFIPENKTAHSYAGALYRKIKKEPLWLRPTGNNTKKMLWLIDKIKSEADTDYIMFMLHSSEFMPGGSPTFKTNESIEILYKQLETIFDYLSNDFEGMTVGDYGLLKLKELVGENV